jgi:hypothetical protein
MVDANIKKLRILKSSLPPIDHDTLKYNLRYRIVSDDRNRVSHWSPIYNLNGSTVEAYTGSLSINPEIITAVWKEEDQLDIEADESYDVFVKFDSGSFIYHGFVSTHSFMFLNEGTSTVHVKVQVISSKKEIKPSLLVYDSGIQSLV